MGKNILVVVDYQYDFYHPSGALYVEGGERLYNNILRLIPQFDGVVFTQDWHPLDHCSFKANGGIWPVHCVNNTIGAGIPVEMLQAARDYTIFLKGCNTNKEEYGAFASPDFRSTVESVAKGREAEIESVVVCGIAGDYCVLETLKNIVGEIGSERVKVFLDGVASIDGGTAIGAYMQEQSIAEFKAE
ncbi:MAG: isochorismatase family protein [Tidjanibacter sp.]|nr:isochorismatase family protein [Tidjanibacter sp.]